MYINESHLLKSSKLGTDLFYRDIKKKKVEKIENPEGKK